MRSRSPTTINDDPRRGKRWLGGCFKGQGCWELGFVCWMLSYRGVAMEDWACVADVSGPWGDGPVLLMWRGGRWRRWWKMGSDKGVAERGGLGIGCWAAKGFACGGSTVQRGRLGKEVCARPWRGKLGDDATVGVCGLRQRLGVALKGMRGLLDEGKRRARGSSCWCAAREKGSQQGVVHGLQRR